jgi:MoxR-like ATPase
LALNRGESLGTGSDAPMRRVSQKQVFEARRRVLQLYMAPELEDYIVHLVLATREPGNYSASLKGWLRFGASPRATLALDRCARAHAWLGERDFVTPEDVQSVAPDCLRHRLLLDYEAEAEGRSVDGFIEALLSRVPVP